MTAVGLALAGLGITLVLSGFRGEDPRDVFRSVFSGAERPAPSLRLPAGAADKLAAFGELQDAQAATTSTGTPNIVEWNGAKLAAHVMPNYQAMIQAAARDGVILRPGSTYRSAAEQIALRKAHCGAGWATAPASSCSPPTARPGHSMHERGEAIDFANLSTAGFNWLKANAARYGFKNLPSERWHWSTNGN